MKKKNRLILALDVTDYDKAMFITKEINDLVDCIKVNYPLVLSCSMDIVKKLSNFSDIICDFKVADIPNTNQLIVKEAIKNNASGIIVHTFIGSDAVKACVDASNGYSIDVFGVIEMTHSGALEFIQPVVDKLLTLAINTGLSGVIVPGTRPDRIKYIKQRCKNLILLAPGIGVQGGSAKDAIIAGADYIIIGRKIYQSEKPRNEIIKILDEIKGV